MPRTLHLIKHARPVLVPGVPAHEWTLAPDALDGIPALADRLDPRPGIVVSSEEPKAKATAQALAARLDVAHRPMVGLHEHLRYTNPVVSDAGFRERMALFFAQPERVVGEESARDACTRFGNAVNAVMLANPQETVAIVAHGTVISLLVAERTGRDARTLHAELPLLGAVTLEWPTLEWPE